MWQVETVSNVHFISFVVDLIHLSKDNICQSKCHFVVVKLQHDGSRHHRDVDISHPRCSLVSPQCAHHPSKCIPNIISQFTTDRESHFKDHRSKFNLKLEESWSDDNKVDTTNRCEALKYYTFFKYVKYSDVSLSNTCLSNI